MATEDEPSHRENGANLDDGSLAEKLPNLFILGAPKCGTTALTSYLAQHPDVFMPPRGKELHYFGSDLTFRNKPRTTLDRYLEYFEPASQERYRLDSGIWYLYSSTAGGEIAAACPEARCIVQLRNPVDMLYSLHSEFLYQGDEDIADFAEALGAEKDRLDGKRIPSTCDIPWALQYHQIAKFGEQLERCQAAFGPDRIHVILHDDFATDTEGAYRRLLEFLEIDKEFETELPVVNSNKVVRSAAIREFLRHPPEPVRKLGRLALRNQSTRRIVGWRLLALNTSRVARPPMDKVMRRELQSYLESDINRLGNLMDRDLSSWWS